MTYRDNNGVLRCTSYGRSKEPRVMTAITSEGYTSYVVPVGYLPIFNAKRMRFGIIRSEKP